MKIIKTIASIITLGFLVGCIPVDDLGDYWNKGKIDPSIEGHWKKQGIEFRSQDKYVSFEKAGGHYLFKASSASMPAGSQKTSDKAKSINLGDHMFLILVEDIGLLEKTMLSGMERSGKDNNAEKAQRATSGGLQRYAIKDDVLTLYFLNDEVLYKAIKEGKVAGKLPKNDDPNNMDLTTPTIAKLDEKSIRFLIQIANDPKKWNRVERYTRVADLENSLKKSRAYPATKDTPKNTRINVVLPDLKYFADGKSGILKRHLQSSPEWKVFDERGETICYKREKIGDQWKVSLNGYKSTDYSDSSLQTRHLFRFAKKGGGAFTNKYNRDMTIVVNPLVGSTYLNLKSSDQGIESYIAIGQKGIWFEFFEQSNIEPRTHTKATLKWLEEFLGKIRKAEDEIIQNGFASELMPKNGVRKGKPHLKIKDGFQRGLYDIYGWVNPGAAGKVYLKVYEVKSGKQLSEDTISWRSSEHIGWSKNPDMLFFYNPHITVYEGDWEHQYEARFELWHHPDTGKETKLIEETRMIYGWQR